MNFIISDTQIELRGKAFEGEFSCGEEKLQLTSCCNSDSTLSNLPSWLKDERPKNNHTTSDHHHHHDQVIYFNLLFLLFQFVYLVLIWHKV